MSVPEQPDLLSPREIANRIREALYDIEGGTRASVQLGEDALNRLVAELEGDAPRSSEERA